MASDLKSNLVMTAFQSRPTVHLMGNPAVTRFRVQAGFVMPCLDLVLHLASVPRPRRTEARGRAPSRTPSTAAVSVVAAPPIVPVVIGVFLAASPRRRGRGTRGEEVFYLSFRWSSFL